jgi:two-component system, response regulator YesN
MAERSYRIILVDDEAIVREGISSCVPWGSNGFELAGMFEHGVEALAYIEKNPVDVVISDINMPRMDGLALSRILTERFPSIMILLLTGYDDFEYAQEAVRNQVRRFLLKPITAAELEEVLEEVGRELDRVRDEQKQQELLLEKLHRSFPLLKERFLYRLVTGRLSAEQLGRRSDYFQWHDRGFFYQVQLIRIPAQWSDLDRIALEEFLKEVTRDGDEVFQNSEEHIVLLLQGNNRDELLSRGTETARQAFHRASGPGTVQISIGIGEVVDSPARLKRSYSGALSSVDYSRLLGVSRIISIHEVRGRERISPEGFSDLTRNLLDRLKDGRPEESRQALKQIILYMEQHYLTPVEASHYFNRLHLQLIFFLQELGLFSADEPELSIDPGIFSSVTAAKEYFRRMIDAVEEKVRLRRSDMLNSRIDKARRIIAERLGESGFCLKDICDELYLSTSQFSHLFKEGTGQTFVEYLTARRVEEAKKLLKTTDLKAYEIAERVGYTDPRYFSIIFKKVSGMTAMEYRRSLAE